VSLADRIAKIDARVEGRKAQAESSRESMPGMAAIVDDLRRVFGNTKVTFAQEGGITRGRPFEDRYPRRVTLAEFMRYVSTGENWERYT
jgi:hypothetical protein